MTRDHLEANWKELAGFARTHWSTLTTDEAITGKAEQLTAPFQHGNGIPKRAAEERCPVLADFVHVPKAH